MSPYEMLVTNSFGCEWFPAPFLFFSGNVFSPLIYYSHLFPTITGLLLAFLVWRQNRKDLVNRIFIFLSVAFATWTLLDLLLWADANPDRIMFAWTAQLYVDPLIYISALYLAYVFIKRQDAPFWTKLVVVGAYLPVLFLAPTSYTLEAFDYTNCDREAIEGIAWQYVYAIELAMLAVLIGFSSYQAWRARRREVRQQIGLLAVGLALFLFAFSWGNIIGSFSEDWTLAQYGLFGMPIFLGTIIYLMARFQAFRIQVLGTSVFVSILWILLFSILFLPTIEVARPVVVVTLVFFGLIGVLLVRSVRHEIEQRERIEKLAKDLEAANARLKELDTLKSEFLSIASHQLRAPITAVRGYVANVLDGSYGPVPKHLIDPLHVIRESSRLMANSIEDYLNISRIEQGRMKYEKTDFDLAKLAGQVAEELRPQAEDHKLTLSFEGAEGVMVHADVGKVKQVFTNLVDNAIKYTEKGGITVSVAREGGKAVFRSKDTGIGIAAEDIGKLFSKFTRARGANDVNTTGTGLGLYVAKQLAEGNGGTVRIESEGRGKGSVFIVELPLK